MTSKLKTDVLETSSGSGTIALNNQLSGMTTESMPSGSVVQVQTFLLGGTDFAISTTTETVLEWGPTFTKKYANSKLVCHLQWFGYYSASPSYWWLRAMVNGTNVSCASSSDVFRGSGTVMTHNQTQYSYGVAAHQQWNCHFWDDQNTTTAALTFSFRQNASGTFQIWGTGGPKLIITEIKQ